MSATGINDIVVPTFIFLTGAVLFFRMLKRQEQQD